MSAAEVIETHFLAGAFGESSYCGCSKPWDAAHVLAALKAAGYAVMELPEPQEVLPILDTMAGLRYFAGTETGRRMAAALLAAANAAEASDA